MKKIVYSLALAVFAVSAASAVAPLKVNPVISEKKLVRSSAMMQAQAPIASRVMKTDKSLFGSKALVSRADETESESAPLNALFSASEGSFWTSLTPTLWYFGCCGQTGYKNGIIWNNASTGADSYEWAWGEVVGADQNGYVYEDYTSKSEDLVMELLPGAVYKAPTLTAFAGSQSSVCTPTVEDIYCGQSPDAWGFGMDTETGEVDYDRVPGVSSFAHEFTDFSGVPFFSQSLADSKNYDSNGVYIGWKNYFKGSDKVTFPSYKQIGYASYIPAKPSPYMLESVFGDFQLVCTEDVILTFNVYLLGEGGEVDMTKPVGRGEFSVSKGNYPASETAAFDVITLYALDEDGYETDQPVCIGTGERAFLTVEGVDNPAITMFMLGTQDGYEIPIEKAADSDLWGFIETMTPTHAYTLFDVEVKPAGEESYKSLEIAPCPSIYYANDEQTALYYPSDFALFYNVYFPMVINVTEGSDEYATGDFTVTVPTTGGEASVDVVPTYNIVALEQDGQMTSKSSEWITYTTDVITDEKGQYVRVNISAEALPEGTAGRQGVVYFEGYAMDFVIVVNQGEVAGISTVPAAANGKVELFDLQGRKLNAVPANGIYLERQGNKTVKRIAK